MAASLIGEEVYINNNNASLNILAGRIESQFEKVFPTLVERFVKWDPCNPDKSNVWLNLAPIPGPTAGSTDPEKGTITLDSEKIGGEP